MKAIFDSRQRSHDPKHFMANGLQLASPEVPARIDALQAGALAAGCEFSEATDFGLGPISASELSVRIILESMGFYEPGLPCGFKKLVFSW